MPRNLARLALMAMAMLSGAAVSSGQPTAPTPLLRLTVLFNNVPQRTDLIPGWGFSCLVEGAGKTLLFDTGADSGVLLRNMRRLGLQPRAVQAVVLSHIHADHSGGLDGFLTVQPAVPVYLPAGSPLAFQQAVAARGAKVRAVGQGGRLFANVWSTGSLDGELEEQALILETPRGLVVITGCAHPGIVRVAETAGRLTGRRIHLLMGGFHLMGKDAAEIQTIIAQLKALGVEKVAPSHCTGEAAIALFRQAWGKDFVDGGLGAVIEVALR